MLNSIFGGHLLLTQTLNLLLTPVNVASVIPFKLAGELVLQVERVNVSFAETRAHALAALKNSPLAFVHAVVRWTLFCAVAVVCFFTVLRPLTWCCHLQLATEATEAEKTTPSASRDWTTV